jgi:replication-associated recombination protein RarA
MEKQLNLHGEPIEPDEENPDIAVLKSALQKSIRRGLTEKAMSFALLLLEKSWFVCWRRLRIIATEDVGQPEIINAVENLYYLFLEFKNAKKGEISWDGKRITVLAALIMAEAKKDRRADEFLELWDVMQKRRDVQALQNLKELWTAVPDEAYDVHTVQGRRMGRKEEYWYAVSSKCENMTEAYAKWRSWWEGLMLALCKKRSGTQNTNVLTLEGEKKCEDEKVNINLSTVKGDDEK